MSKLWTRRQALWFIVGTFGGTALHACNNSAQTNSTDTVSASIGLVTWVGLAPLHIAIAKGFFQEQGLTLEPKIFSVNADSNAAFAAGRLNGIAPVTAEAVVLAATGADFRVVLVEDISVGADGILARKNIQDIQSFKGKRIAVEKSSVSHFFLLQVLNEAGLSEKDVTVVSMAPDAAAAAYQAGQIEIAVSYSPFLEQANTAQTDGRIIYDSTKMPGAIADLYAFETKFIEAYPQAVEGFVRGILKALDFLQTNREEALAIAANELSITPEELDATLKGLKLPDLALNLEMLANPQSDLYIMKSMEKLADFLQTHNQIQSIPNLSGLIEPKFIQAVQANPSVSGNT